MTLKTAYESVLKPVYRAYSQSNPARCRAMNRIGYRFSASKMTRKRETVMIFKEAKLKGAF
jgi:hypothetical protein